MKQPISSLRLINTHCRLLFSTLLTCLLCICFNNASAQFAVLGTGTTSNTATTYPTPYGAYYSGQRAQYLYYSSELTSLGFPVGAMHAIGFYVTATNGSGTHDSFEIKIAHTTLSSLSTWIPAATLVYSSNNVVPRVGLNIMRFNRPFIWDGVSNIVVEVCHWNGASTATANASVLASNVSNACISAYTHTANPCGNNSLVPTVYNTRPNLTIWRLHPCMGPPMYATLAPSGTVTACPGNTYTINAVKYDLSFNIGFTWIQSTDGGLTWMPATGGSGSNTISYTTPPITTDSILYRMVTACYNSGHIDSTLSVLFRSAQPVYAALPFSENFESWISRCDTSEVPSVHWTNAPYSGNSSWRRDDSGTRARWTMPDSGTYLPAAQHGAHSARFHAYTALTRAAGAGNLSAYIDCSSSIGMKILTFYMRTDSGTVQPADSLFVDLSLNGGSSFSTVGAYGPGSGGWDLKRMSFVSDSPKTVIRFRAYSQVQKYSDIGLDSVSVTALSASSAGSTAHTHEFAISPNPASKKITVYSPRGGILILTDIVGRRAKTIRLSGGAGGLSTISLEGLLPGLFTYRYISDGMESITGKLLITE